MTPLPDPTRGTAWLMSASQEPGLILADWDGDGRTQLPAGRLFDVVALPHAIGAAAVEHVRRSGAVLGPVLETAPDGPLEFLVEVGGAERWKKWDDVPGAGTAGWGEVLECPMPGRTRAGRAWLYPPDGSGALTDPAALHDAATAAARRG